MRRITPYSFQIVEETAALFVVGGVHGLAGFIPRPARARPARIGDSAKRPG
jgi:hypothetical protein